MVCDGDVWSGGHGGGSDMAHVGIDGNVDRYVMIVLTISPYSSGDKVFCGHSVWYGVPVQMF